MQETRVQSLGGEDPLEEDMATHFSILAWRFPWTEEPGGLQSLGLQRVKKGQTWLKQFSTHAHKPFWSTWSNCHLREVVFVLGSTFIRFRRPRFWAQLSSLLGLYFLNDHTGKVIFWYFVLWTLNTSVYSSNHHHSHDAEQFPSQKIPCRITLSPQLLSHLSLRGRELD